MGARSLLQQLLHELALLLKAMDFAREAIHFAIEEADSVLKGIAARIATTPFKASGQSLAKVGIQENGQDRNQQDQKDDRDQHECILCSRTD